MAAAAMTEQHHVILCKLGEGTFGEVFKAQRTSSGEVVALKKIRIRAPEAGIPKSIFREVMSMQLLEHSHCLRCSEVYPSGGYVGVAFDCFVIPCPTCLPVCG
jgi:serine/threonine protein kinase